MSSFFMPMLPCPYNLVYLPANALTALNLSVLPADKNKTGTKHKKQQDDCVIIFITSSKCV